MNSLIINFTDKNGRTRLHRACMDSDYDEVAELLHDEAVNISATDKDGRTPLHHACSMGNERIVGCLIEESANCVGPALHGNDAHSQIKHFINLTDDSKVRNIVLIITIIIMIIS